MYHISDILVYREIEYIYILFIRKYTKFYLINMSEIYLPTWPQYNSRIKV